VAIAAENRVLIEHAAPRWSAATVVVWPDESPEMPQAEDDEIVNYQRALAGRDAAVALVVRIAAVRGVTTSAMLPFDGRNPRSPRPVLNRYEPRSWVTQSSGPPRSARLRARPWFFFLLPRSTDSAYRGARSDKITPRDFGIGA